MASLRGSLASALNFRRVQLDARQFWDPRRVAEERRRSIAALFRSLLPDINTLRDASALDLGCGEGGGVLALRDAGAKSVLGIDLAADRIAVANELVANDLSCTCRVGDGERIGVADASFDFVLCCEILEHVRCPRSFLIEVARVLRPDGAALITFPSFASVTGPHLWHLVNIPFGQYLLGLDAVREAAAVALRGAGQACDGTWDPLNRITIRSFRRILAQVPDLSIQLMRVHSRFLPMKPLSRLPMINDLAGDSVRALLRRRRASCLQGSPGGSTHHRRTAS
jgi:SAM-dependent methyltransferase